MVADKLRLVQKRARDLVITGETLLEQLSSISAFGSSSEVLQKTVANWLESWSEMINDDDLQVTDNAKAVKGVPLQVSNRLWDIEKELVNLAEKRRETKSA